MKNFFATLASLAIILLCLGTPNYSKLWLDFNVGSLHGDDDYNERDCPTCEKRVRDYNNFNPGLGLSYELTDYLDLSIGGYYNSFRKTSFYSGGTLKYPVQLTNFIEWEPGIFGGAATGYKDTPKDNSGYVYGGLLPYGGISNSLIFGDTLKATVGFVPDIKGKYDAPYYVVTFQVGYKF